MPVEGSWVALPAASAEVTAADSEPGEVGDVPVDGVAPWLPPPPPAPPPELVPCTVTVPFMNG